MTRNKKIFLFASIGVLSIGVLATGISYSVAAYTAAKPVNQTIGYSGVARQSIYLDLYAWHTEDNTYSTTSNYYMYAYGDSGSTWIAPTTTTNSLDNITIYGTGSVSGRYLKLFLYDSVKYNGGIIFTRIKEEAAGPSWEDVMHKTADINYSTNKHNYYCITSMGEWGISPYSSKMLYESNNQLTFDEPS